MYFIIMVFDHLSNFKKYVLLSPLFAEVSQFLDQAEFSALSLGRHDVGDQGIFALVSRYVPKKQADGFIECHQKYIDIQIVVEGIEAIGICHKSDCTQMHYDEEKDFQKLIGEVDFITMKPGSFAVFFPADGHKPGLQTDNSPQTVKKVVIKVPFAKKASEDVFF